VPTGVQRICHFVSGVAASQQRLDGLPQPGTPVPMLQWFVERSVLGQQLEQPGADSGDREVSAG
jgi:hypothetical protein